MLKFKIELDGLEEVKKMFSSDLLRKAARSALDKTGTKIKQEIVGAVSSNYYIKPKDVGSAIRVKRTTQNELSVALYIHGPRLRFVKYFNAKQDRQGIYVNVSKSKTIHIPHAFIPTMESGHKEVFVRMGKKRLPIEEWAGPSIPELAGSRMIFEEIQKKYQQTIHDLFMEEMEKRTRA